VPPPSWQLTWTSRKLNSSPSTLDDKDVLKKPLCTPLVKKIDLRFPLGLEVTARNLKGVTIKDALDAIYKQYKKKVSPLPRLLLFFPRHSLTPSPRLAPQADDELENPVLAGFEWDKDECWTRFIVHQKKAGAPTVSKKAKKAKAEAGED